MKAWILAAVLGGATLQVGAAPLILNYGAAGIGAISFNSISGGADFSFPPNGAAASDFSVTTISGFSNPNSGASMLTGLLGDITGTYTYLTSQITTIGPVQTAPVSGTGMFIIHDGLGHDFTANLDFVDVDTAGVGGTINFTGDVNLTNLSYSGTNANLLELAASPAGIVTATFQFTNAVSLTSIATMCTSGNCSTSFSGSLSTVPEPLYSGIVLVGGTGLVLFIQRKRSAKANA